jgi:hypothetical protein
MRGRADETWVQKGRLATQLLEQYGCRFALPVRLTHTADLSVRSVAGWRIFGFCRAISQLARRAFQHGSFLLGHFSRFTDIRTFSSDFNGLTVT